MKRTFALSLLLFGLMSCSLLDENKPGPQPSNTAPTVTLSASTLSGVAPLQVTFTATASDAENDTLSYSWSIPGAANSPTASQTFTAAGSYPVSVKVSDGQLETSASTTVTVTEAGTSPNPVPKPTPKPDIALNITASPGGPVPWGVTYEVNASGKVPKGSTLSVTCAEQPATDLSSIKELKIQGDVFSCIHLVTGEKVAVTLKAGDGAVLSQKEQTADVQASTGVPFEGGWWYPFQFGKSTESYTHFGISEKIDDFTGRGEGTSDFDDTPTPGTFTLTTKQNKLTLSSDFPGQDKSPSGTFVFIGAHNNESLKEKQVFYSPSTNEAASDYGYLIKER